MAFLEIYSMQLLNENNYTIDALSLPFIQKAKLTASVIRLDKVHPVVSGNKWFKLKEYLHEATKGFKKVIVTFGGAFSNHIIATAAACNQQGLQPVGIIRGEKPAQLSHTLQDAQQYGMQLYFVNREVYKEKVVPAEIWNHYKKEDVYLIAEGGYGLKGMEGAATILSGVDVQAYDYIIAAVGTGTTLAGLIHAATHKKVIGISALKNNFSLEDEVKALLPPHENQSFQILHQFHFGGYAKHKPELITFMNNWYRQTGIPTDFVYTAKMFYAFEQLCNEGYFLPGSNILLVHSGGLQGNASLPKETLIF